jgi:hypothetical protein
MVYAKSAENTYIDTYNLHFPLPVGQNVLWIVKRFALSFKMSYAFFPSWV